MKMYTLNSEVYLDKFNKCYKKIVTINDYPEGPLREYTKMIPNNKLSPFQENTCNCTEKKCFYALTSLYNKNDLMLLDDIPNLFGFLVSNNYIIDDSITKMMFKSGVKMTNTNLICFIKYN